MVTRTTKVSVGLFATWALSDVEELCTMRRSSREVLPRLPEFFPIPDELRRAGISRQHLLTGMAVMASVMGAAAADGVRSGGRSPVFRGVLLAFGLHGFGHLAMAGAARQYVSGLLTAPTIVIPYWLWAREELAAEGIADVDRASLAVAAAGMPVLLGIHTLVYRLLDRSTRPRGRRRHAGSAASQRRSPR